MEAARLDAARAVAEYRAAGDWRGLASARQRQAGLARSAGDLAGAEEYLRAALSIYIMISDNYSAGRALAGLAELRFVAGDYIGAADLNRQAVERLPGDTEALTGLAYAEWQAGSPADAEVTFSQVLRWASDTVTALAGRGQVRADLGDYGAAVDDLDRALRFPMDRDAEADARSARALALAGLGRADEAQDELHASFQLEPDRARTRLRAGRIAALSGHREEARAEVERALMGRPALSRSEKESASRLLLRFA
ncbi:MAG: Tetratricopeptide repeat protein [Actinomycetia bacterium]|nr:Tetratricopeptide repeat protein [Actinomycetes bacterium]